ncbi:hypothetical protein LS70_009230 [Helicobacter sp. MIT 11-5569]|uniref:hypothetical protein n=1 Tax=Helicobacter sp. MIT 11-5569 TaxID=1548151 RepID=UPI0010FE7089|nr:hypothetical protein [Helicobacter sp. MIT 11-5569]TLD80352.1 hypothetical protein LS70_009230 [Helicobacter sp. MIT 11-5569]
MNITNPNNKADITSTNSPYLLKTLLEKDKAYSTLGIQLKSPKPQDTFNNNGNFNIKLTNIDFKSIESITNHSITKDSPIFIYTQDSKQTFIAKLQDKQTTYC